MATKRTWVVYIEQGIGHEYANMISETDFYGLFTVEEAERLVEDLNKILDDGSKEPDRAACMPLEILTPAGLLRAIRNEMKSRQEAE